MKRPPYVAFFGLAALMMLQAGSGLAYPWVYRNSEAWMLAAWKGNDVITLFVAAPLLVFATQWARTGSARGLLLAIGLIAFELYNDAYYLLGAELGRAFPLYVVIAIVSVVTLTMTLHRVKPETLTTSRTPRRLVGTFLVVLGGGLAAVWLLQWAMFVMTGKVPAVGLDAFKLIASLDLTVLCTLFIAGGVLLWRKNLWAGVVASTACIVGTTYGLVLMAGTFAAMHAGIAGQQEQLPIWSGIFFTSGLAGWGLLQAVEARPRDPWFWSSPLHR